jgi:hypothetical protein
VTIEQLDRPITIGEAARLLDVPGPSTGAKAQRLRRLEQDGSVPPGSALTQRPDKKK